MLRKEQLKSSVSEMYHENTKYHAGLVQPPALTAPELAEKLRAFKIYRRAPVVPLPEDFPVGEMSLEEAISQRRSIREFSGDAITLFELGKLLFFTNGITTARQDGKVTQFLRAAPSAGALYPIEIYPVVLNVTDLASGIYHYNVRDHALELLRPGDYRGTLHSLLLYQDFISTASLLFLMTAVFPRVKGKYGERGYRFSLLDAGHIAQNTYLVATAMNLGAVTIGGFLDDDLNALLGVDGVEEAMVYTTAIGKPKG